MIKFIHILICSNFLIAIYSASLLNLITGQIEGKSDDTNNCICNGTFCICCVDFNVSFTSLGGPGCIRLNYLSPEEGLNLNISYSNSLIHSERVKGPNPAPICLNVISTFAQICAKFFNFETYTNGLSTCVQLEPTLLEETQTEFPIGCFEMNSDGIKHVLRNFSTEISQSIDDESNRNSTDENDDSQEIIAGLNAEEIIEVINETANRGIALISNWLGFLSNTNKEDSTVNSSPTASGPSSSSITT